MAQSLGISRAAIYSSIRRYNERVAQGEKIIHLVKQIRKRMPRLGVEKLYFLLKPKFRELGIKCGRDKLYQILRNACMLVPKKKKFTRTTQSNHLFNKHSNKIKGVKLKRPEQIWQSDITYIKTKEGNLYLSLITDAYSKKIMGYELSDNLKTESVKRALLKAISNRKYPKRKLIHHSDRGLQYCNPAYTQELEDRKIKISMTTKYDPYENSIAERINGILKDEFSISDRRITKQEAKRIIDTSIEIYNDERPHLSCEMMTPNQAHTKGKYVYKKWGKYSITESWN